MFESMQGICLAAICVCFACGDLDIHVAYASFSEFLLYQGMVRPSHRHEFQVK